LAFREFLPQVLVTCAHNNDPSMFFVPVTSEDEVFASQALSVMGAAHLSGKLLEITYDPADTSGELIGCFAPACKRILAIDMVDAHP
jgi:hypothetical protein